jgi:hypothetical protein
VSELVHQLRNSGALDPAQLEAAFRRQQIYGGSLDTVLLELELVAPARMQELLATACGLPAAPVELVGELRERGWDRVPAELVDLGWVMPLGTVDGRFHVAVHPELSDERLATLRREVPGVVAMVTAECCLAKLASERTRSVIPQRYAVLAASFLHALREQTRRPAPAAAPWMSAPREPQAAPPLPSAPTPDPTVVTQNVPTFPPPPRAVDAPRGPASERTRTLFQPPPVRNPHVGAPVPEPPPWQSGSIKPTTETNLRAVLDGTAAAAASGTTGAPPTMRGAASQSPEPIAEAWAEQFAAARVELQSAHSRDTVTDALASAAMLITPRVALFGIKREGLRGLAGPGAIPGIAGTTIPVGAVAQAAIDSGPTRTTLRDLDLRLAVEQERPVPCIFAPVRVMGRPVLLVYMDRDGLEFSDEDLRRARDLSETAGRSLEEVLRRMAPRESTPAPSPASAPTPALEAPPMTAASRPPSLTPRAQAAQWFARPPGTPITPPGPAREGGRTLTIGSDEIDRPAAPRLPRLVEAEPPPRLHTLHGEGPAGLPHVDPTVAPPARDPARITTLPGLGEVPLAHARTLPPDEAVIVAPPARIVTLTQTPPPAPEPPARGITPLSTPIGPPTTRGSLVFDDEDPTKIEQPPPADSIEARVDACLQSAMGGGASASELLQFGEKALIRIASRFPGPIDVFRRDLDTLPPPAAHGALLRVVIQLGEPIVPHLLELFDHRSANVRFYAAFVFQALRDDRVVGPIAELAFDADSDVRAISMRVLETYSRSPGYPRAVARVRSELSNHNRTRQLFAARALGTLRDVHSVSQLVDLLGSDDRYTQEAALESLCSVTGQQLGLKPQRWRKWYADNASRHRVEWIISTLAHRDVNVRRWAADELRRITGQPIEFPATGDQVVRDAALRRWMEWWHVHGRQPDPG